jgi:oligopeptide/dipeptide ABC transporter ATP-binding protein
MSILLITHNLGIVGGIADRLLVMYAGQIVEAGPAAEVLARPKHPYTQCLIRSVPSLDADVERLTAIPGAVPRLGAWPGGCRFHPRCPVARETCGQREPSLESAAEGIRHEVRCPHWNS